MTVGPQQDGATTWLRLRWRLGCGVSAVNVFRLIYDKSYLLLTFFSLYLHSTVTQNFDGSPMKEVLCVKCARGFKPSRNTCVRCAACACARNEVIVRDACVPRSFVNFREKYEGDLHPYALLDIVKYEYMCIVSIYGSNRRK